MHMADRPELATGQSLGTFRKVRNSWCRPLHREHGRRCCCLSLQVPPDRPDPASYSQEERLAQGLIPTWDSPDMKIYDWNPWRLLPESQVTVRNLSASASAMNASVHFFTSPFGLGTQRTLFSTKIVNL